ncbi:unnamed protein product [Durusdinium trenchii]|uniref:Uncharacterized protein n=1 Tax=Durusdinium trenchii TaxID=1381693 RepID=A0ABP0SAZ5_9DINO
MGRQSSRIPGIQTRDGVVAGILGHWVRHGWTGVVRARLQNDIAEQLYSAFKQGKGQRDNIIALEGEDASLGMGKYLFEERNGQELGTSYGALSVSGEDGGQTNLTMWFKREAYHAVPAMVNLWNNARMQLLGIFHQLVRCPVTLCRRPNSWSRKKCLEEARC